MNVIALLCGALFGAGVCISGMVRPSKVLGFLDFGGAWDPSSWWDRAGSAQPPSRRC